MRILPRSCRHAAASLPNPPRRAPPCCWLRAPCGQPTRESTSGSTSRLPPSRRRSTDTSPSTWAASSTTASGWARARRSPTSAGFARRWSSTSSASTRRSCDGPAGALPTATTGATASAHPPHGPAARTSGSTPRCRPGRSSTIPNAFGTVEFIRFCRLAGAQPYLAANLRSLPPRDFYQWVEFCNSPAGTTYDGRRARRAGREGPAQRPLLGHRQRALGLRRRFHAGGLRGRVPAFHILGARLRRRPAVHRRWPQRPGVRVDAPLLRQAHRGEQGPGAVACGGGRCTTTRPTSAADGRTTGTKARARPSASRASSGSSC